MGSEIINSVIAGDYKDYIVCQSTTKMNGLKLSAIFKKDIEIDSTTVETYEIMDEKNSKSMTSGVIRGAVGAAIFGPIGAVAGAASAKSKSRYRVSVLFKDGKKSLLYIDQKTLDKLTEILF